MPSSSEQKASGMRSVTEILEAYTEPYLVAWRLKNGVAKTEAISRNAREIGIEVDRLIQMDIKGEALGVISDNVAVRNALEGWKRFKEDHPQYIEGVDSIQVELVSGNIVGHADIVHKLEVSDVKTGSSLTLRPKYCVQASKYALMSGKDRASIIILSKSVAGQYLYVWWDGYLLHYFGEEVFDAFKTIYEYGQTVNVMLRNYLEGEML